MMDLPVELPRFESNFQPSEGSEVSKSVQPIRAEVKLEEMAAVLPSLDDLDIN